MLPVCASVLVAASVQTGQFIAASTALWSLAAPGSAVGLPCAWQMSALITVWVSICPRWVVLICPIQNCAHNANTARAKPKRMRCVGSAEGEATLQIVKQPGAVRLVVRQVDARSHAPQGLACCGILWLHLIWGHGASKLQ